MSHACVLKSLVLGVLVLAASQAEGAEGAIVINGGYVTHIEIAAPNSVGQAHHYITLYVWSDPAGTGVLRKLHVSMYRNNRQQILAKAVDALEKKASISWQFDGDVGAETISNLWIVTDIPVVTKPGCVQQVCCQVVKPSRRRCLPCR